MIYWSKSAFFHHFYPSQSLLKPLHCNSGTLGHKVSKSGIKKLSFRLHDGENRMILWSLILSQYQRVTDRWTDIRRTDMLPIAKLHSRIEPSMTKSAAKIVRNAMPSLLQKIMAERTSHVSHIQTFLTLPSSVLFFPSLADIKPGLHHVPTVG